MDQIAKARAFHALHKTAAPLVLWNIWDAGSAKAVAVAGASALATGSFSVAAARGYGDGEDLPLELALRIARQIVRAVDLPVSVDFEGGYAVAPAEVGAHAARLIETGAIGLNFEDRVVGGKGLHPVEAQAARIAAIRQAADAAGVPFFINARTDVFLQGGDAPVEGLTDEALARAVAYAAAGADGVFVPGLTDLAQVKRISEGQALPVNVMRQAGGAEVVDFAAAGAARISHGPLPYLAAMKTLAGAAVVS